jgi:hypothetical protein
MDWQQNLYGFDFDYQTSVNEHIQTQSRIDSQAFKIDGKQDLTLNQKSPLSYRVRQAFLVNAIE